MAIQQAMGMPKGRGKAHDYLKGFVEEMKASGFCADALKRSNQPDAVVAPRPRAAVTESLSRVISGLDTPRMKLLAEMTDGILGSSPAMMEFWCACAGML